MALLLAMLALGMGTCGSDGPTSITEVGQIDRDFVAATTTTPATNPTTPTPAVCGPTGECVCEEGFEPDNQGNCVVIVNEPTTPTPGGPTPNPGPGGPTTTTVPAGTTWAMVDAQLSASGCMPHHTTAGGSPPISQAQWQAATPSVLSIPGTHPGGAIPAPVIAIFTSWQAGGFQP